jgi:hypothetical protein
MHWIIQDHLYKEEGMRALLDTLERFSIPHNVVSVDKAGGSMVPDVHPAGYVMVCGTYALGRIAAERGWWPGTFMNSNHDHRKWVEHWGERMLNAQAVTCRFAEVNPRWSRTFIRPAQDTKFFDGQVLDAEEIMTWRSDVLAGRKSPVKCSAKLSADTEVVHAEAVDVYCECRFFVVDGEIVGSTTYRVGSDVVSLEDVEPAAQEFALEAIACWHPARGFVLDVALVAQGYRIVEVNCLNTAGFYGADVQRIVMSVDAMERQQDPYPQMAAP